MVVPELTRLWPFTHKSTKGRPPFRLAQHCHLSSAISSLFEPREISELERVDHAIHDLIVGQQESIQ
jgi:hypothetical protein